MSMLHAGPGPSKTVRRATVFQMPLAQSGRPARTRMHRVFNNRFSASFLPPLRRVGSRAFPASRAPSSDRFRAAQAPRRAGAACVGEAAGAGGLHRLLPQGVAPVAASWRPPRTPIGLAAALRAAPGAAPGAAAAATRAGAGLTVATGPGAGRPNRREPRRGRCGSSTRRCGRGRRSWWGAGCGRAWWRWRRRSRGPCRPSRQASRPYRGPAAARPAPPPVPSPCPCLRPRP